MPTEELKAMLSRVHTELENTDDLPEKDERALRSLLDEIEDRLDELEEASAAGEESVGERMSMAMGEFQATHPTLAFTLRRLVDTLQKIGI